MVWNLRMMKWILTFFWDLLTKTDFLVCLFNAKNTSLVVGWVFIANVVWRALNYKSFFSLDFYRNWKMDIVVQAFGALIWILIPSIFIKYFLRMLQILRFLFTFLIEKVGTVPFSRLSNCKTIDGDYPWFLKLTVKLPI